MESSLIKSLLFSHSPDAVLASLNPSNNRLTKLLDKLQPEEESVTGEALPVDLPALYATQQQIKDEGKRFNVLDIGRRAGKTFLGVHLAVETAAAGEPVGWFAPSYKYVLEVWRDLQRPLHAIRGKCRINATERRIELPNGGLIEVWTLENEDAGRGRKYKRAVIDEAAMVPKLKSSWEESIRPTLTDLQGDAWFLSTPKGLNYFYDLFQRGQDRLTYPDWQSWQLPSSVNPFLPASEIEAIRAELPELAFKQEILAEFLTGDGAVFRNVDACLTAPETTPEEHEGHIKVAGVDWARQHDFSGISVVCCTCRREVFLDRFNQLGWAFQRDRIATALDRWDVEFAYVETNSIGSPNLEAMYEHLPTSRVMAGFETTAKSKPKLIQSLALAFERAHLQWLPDPIARHELLAYEATITKTGHITYAAPDGQWDDTVIMRALAWRAAKIRIPVPLAEWEMEELKLAPHFRRDAIAALPPEERDLAELGRAVQQGMIRKRDGLKHRHWSHEDFPTEASEEEVYTDRINWWQRA